MRTIAGCLHLGGGGFGPAADVLMVLGKTRRFRVALAAENLFPQMQLARDWEEGRSPSGLRTGSG